MRVTLFLALLVSLTFAACNKDSISESQPHTSNLESRSNDVLICHKEGNGSSHLISVNINAVPAHLGHGDVRLDDQDGDGFYPDNDCGITPMGDCDDNDASVYPGAEEVCGDGIDQDCDGEDAACASCSVFTTAELNELLSYQPNYGWWLNENTCYFAPLDLYQEVYLYFPAPLGGRGGANTYDFKDGSGGVAFSDDRKGISRQYHLFGEEFTACKLVLKLFMDDMAEQYPAGPVIDKCNL